MQNYPVGRLAVSPDGRRIAVATTRGVVRVLHTLTGWEAFPLSHGTRVMQIAYFPDGSRLATTADDHAIRIWEAKNGRAVLEITGHTSPVFGLAVSPDGQLIASASSDVLVGSGDHSVRVWDAKVGNELARSDGHPQGFMSVAFSADGMVLAAGSLDGRIRLWDVVRPVGRGIRLVERGTIEHAGEVQMLSFSPDDPRLLVSCSLSTSVCLWDWPNLTLRTPHCGHTDLVNAVAVSPDGLSVASGSADMTVRLWSADCRQEEQPEVRPDDHLADITMLAYSLDGSRIVTAAGNGTVRVWDDNGNPMDTPEPHDRPVTYAALGPNGQWLVSADEFRLRLRPLGGGPYVIDHHDPRGITSVQLSQAGTRLAAGSFDGSVRVWDTDTGALLAFLEDSNRVRRGMKMNPDTNRVSWTQEVTCIAFTHDPNQLIIGTQGGGIGIWSIASGEGYGHLGHRDAVRAAAIAPDGLGVLSGGEDGLLLWWDIREIGQGEQLVVRSYRKQEAAIMSIAFTPDGSAVVAVGTEKTIRLVNFSTGESELLPGMTDVAGVASGNFQCWPMVLPTETTVFDSTTGKPIAWLPVSLDRLAVHPREPKWCGAMGGRLAVFRTERDDNSPPSDPDLFAPRRSALLASANHPVKAFGTPFGRVTAATANRETYGPGLIDRVLSKAPQAARSAAAGAIPVVAFLGVAGWMGGVPTSVLAVSLVFLVTLLLWTINRATGWSGVKHLRGTRIAVSGTGQMKPLACRLRAFLRWAGAVPVTDPLEAEFRVILSASEDGDRLRFETGSQYRRVIRVRRDVSSRALGFAVGRLIQRRLQDMVVPVNRFLRR
jgi:WD40 repeat protein